ncbi:MULTISPECIES: MFS transporter [unclassified Streptomyces]|uniref:MFS transporter n=1 Tax=unclassified Streptomyces TaxID=2593676 RepID=UPI0037FCF221
MKLDARHAELEKPLRRNRDYQVWWLGAAASNTSSYLLTVAVPLFVLETSGSAGQAGLVAGAAAVAKFASSTPAGVLVDLCPRRVLLLLASALQLLAVVSLLVLDRRYPTSWGGSDGSGLRKI